MSDFKPTPEEKAVFEQLDKELTEWLNKALGRGTPEMILGLMSSAVCEGAVLCHIPKEVFLQGMRDSYEVFERAANPDVTIDLNKDSN